MRYSWMILLAAALLAALVSSPATSRSAEAPDATAAAAAATDEDGFVRIFDGKTMKGWRVSERPESFRIVDGALVARGDRAHCFYVGDERPFVNFELKLDG